ncbi:glycosyltransferase family 1 protein [Paracoccus sp. MBLB3053]|uniref:Glycosyltransferase family 1 protein n=1 Tax=Paracoccus aurantius TaxID=3073814 RepID=A0ABU2HWM6_9RHOB|nr:glycosyltransferase family 1 protein [Paracoccus sp. MBLB3053]MDS9468930.1 glycosyltransferase family 1 protein [Paracoccus sp. MBLB3053]
MKTVAINGKFLGAPLNGVHRTAALYTEAMIAHRTTDLNVDIIAPRNLSQDSTFSTLEPIVLRSPLGMGQAWEMISLPLATRKHLLLNFCNLAPAIHPNFVVMIHDAQTYLYPEDYSGRQAVAYRALLPLIARRARKVLTVSEFARDSLARHRVAPLDKISVVHNGTDHLLRVRPDNAVLDRHRLRPKEYALAIGSAKSYKNIARLFDAFAHRDLADFPLVIAGGPPPDRYKNLASPPPANIRFLGPVSDPELRALYSHAAMFLFPSRTEGFGLPPLEAMNLGCAVIAADAGAMPEICAEGALLIDPEDTVAWRNAVIAFRDPARRQARSAAAEARARFFSWERAGARLWEVVEDLVL